VLWQWRLADIAPSEDLGLCFLGKKRRLSKGKGTARNMPPLTIIECVSAHYALLVLVLFFFFAIILFFAFLAAAFPAGVYAYFRPATYGILVPHF